MKSSDSSALRWVTKSLLWMCMADVLKQMGCGGRILYRYRSDLAQIGSWAQGLFEEVISKSVQLY